MSGATRTVVLTGSGATNAWYCLANSTTTSTTTVFPSTISPTAGNVVFLDPRLFTQPQPTSGKLQVADGHSCQIALPDGTEIDVRADGSFEIKDDKAKVIYRAARVRDFNPFLNASDKLEDFIRFCGENGARQGDVLNMPINLFIAWLIVEAAKADQEPEPRLPLLSGLRRHVYPRCRGCGRFVRRELAEKHILVCSTACFDKLNAKKSVKQALNP